MGKPFLSSEDRLLNQFFWCAMYSILLGLKDFLCPKLMKIIKSLLL